MIGFQSEGKWWGRGESGNNVTGKETHFYQKCKGLKKNVIGYDSGTKKSPPRDLNLRISRWPLNITFFQVLQFTRCQYWQGEGGICFKSIIYFYYSIIVESNSEAMSIKEMITHQGSPWLLNKFSTVLYTSPMVLYWVKYHRRCIENSMKNTNTNLRVQRVK